MIWVERENGKEISNYGAFTSIMEFKALKPLYYTTY